MSRPRLSLTKPYRITWSGASARISPQSALVLLARMGSQEMGNEELAEVLWPWPDDMPDQWAHVIDNQISLLRRALAPFGWTILNRRGFGWRLSECTVEQRAAA